MEGADYTGAACTAATGPRVSPRPRIGLCSCPASALGPCKRRFAALPPRSVGAAVFVAGRYPGTRTLNKAESQDGLLQRVADALERLAPPPEAAVPDTDHDAFLWDGKVQCLRPVPDVNRIPLELLRGIDRARCILLENTRRFADGFPANNALLWGARGTGKSSLVKAVHAAVNADRVQDPLRLVEIAREDIETLPALLQALRPRPERYVLFCDDLSFEAGDASYRSLKAMLEGGVEGRPANTLFYATSNRRHLMARSMIENERSTSISPSEAVEEKVSMSDRFGLWLGFHSCSQDDYLEIVVGYAAYYGLPTDDSLRRAALEWSVTRGARSGRGAWQFIQDRAGQLKIALP